MKTQKQSLQWKKMKQALGVLLSVGLFVGALSGCQPNRKGTETPSQTQEQAVESSQSTDSSEPAEKVQMAESSQPEEDKKAENGMPLKGGTVVVGITQEPDFLDPYLAVAAGTKEILFNIYEGLVKLTPQGTFVPCLATNWTVSEDGLTYHFQLRKDVQFHNGSPLTAQDVIASLEHAAGLNGNDPVLAELSGIQKIEEGSDQQEVVITLKEVDPDLASKLTCAIVPADAKDLNENPVGTGPFAFDHYSPQQEIALKKNPHYWVEGRPSLDQVTFKIYGNMDAAYLELKSGLIDIFPYLTQEKAEGLKDLYAINAGQANIVQLLALNNDREPFNNPLVREAVNAAISRGQLIDLVMGSYGVPLASGMSSAMSAFYNDQLPIQLDSDLERAKQCLKEAGMPEGFEMTITVPGNYLVHVDTANILAAQLKKIGINATIETVEWGTWLERVYAGRDYQSTIIALTFDFTPSSVLNRYCSDASNNFTNYHNEEYDKTAKAAAVEIDDTKRAELYKKMQQLLYEDHASVFLQDPMNLTAVRRGLLGYTQYPAYVQDMALVYYADENALQESLTQP